MLELRHIKKSYRVGEIETPALADITVNFREREFVAILGASGSGKTTCLNLIGAWTGTTRGKCASRAKRPPIFLTGTGTLTATTPSVSSFRIIISSAT